MFRHKSIISFFKKGTVVLLLIPSEELMQQDLAKKINERLKELDWNSEDLSKHTGISLLRVRDILNNNIAITDAESRTVEEVLNIQTDFSSWETKENLLKSLLNDMA